jgi:hypothetical protein
LQSNSCLGLVVIKDKEENPFKEKKKVKYNNYANHGTFKLC